MKFLLEKIKPWFLTLVLGLAMQPILAQDIVEPLSPPRLVNDYLDLLSEQEYTLLENKLRNYRDSTSTEIAVVILSSTEPYAIDDYTIRLAEKWKVGAKGMDNGLVILVAIDDRSVNISTGYGMEEKITDLDSRRIIDRYVLPHFKEEAYFTGLDQATSMIMSSMSGEFKAKDEKNPNIALSLLFGLMIVYFIFFVLFRKARTVKRNHYGGRRDMGLWTAILLSSQMGRSSGSGWSDFSKGSGSFGGGSSFGGFGGGSFGGGGASGSW